MKLEIIIFSLMTTLVLSRAAKTKTKECGVNKIYETCGTSCPRKCDNLEPLVCDRRCNNGCFCKEGYVLYYDGVTCVLPEKCKKLKGKSKSKTYVQTDKSRQIMFPRYMYPYKRYYHSFNQRLLSF